MQAVSRKDLERQEAREALAAERAMRRDLEARRPQFSDEDNRRRHRLSRIAGFCGLGSLGIACEAGRMPATMPPKETFEDCVRGIEEELAALKAGAS